MKRSVQYTAILLLFVHTSAHALDTLRVGRTDDAMSWTSIVESAQFVGVSPDSIWTWATQRGDNLVTGLKTRGGFIAAQVQVLTPSGYVDALSERKNLDHWIDGDAGTAWGPDSDLEVERRGTFYIDLGAAFRVDRLRLYPRLDREHSGLVLGSFKIASSDGRQGSSLDAPYRTIPGLAFSAFNPNRQPVIDLQFQRRDVRYIRLKSNTGEPWELAEFEVYAEGTVPDGFFTSIPLFIRGGYPIWGRMFYEEGDLQTLPIAVQTRTGPDEEPLHYFLQRGDELERVSARDYAAFNPLDFSGAAQVQLGPILPNPEWSPWQTVTDGIVSSPAPRRYIQFRVEMNEPGTALENLLVEYVQQPLAEELIAEVSPLVVSAGQPTDFTLSIQVQIDQFRGDTGFRYLQVRTPAQVEAITAVRVDDREVLFTPEYGQDGFTVDIWKRITQAGTFIQIEFTASVLRDGTPFEVRALDIRTEESGIESVYQTARPGDVDPLSAGGELRVRLDGERSRLIENLVARTATISPNDDGTNDALEVSYDLLKLTDWAPVSFQIYDLHGALVAQGRSRQRSGRFVRVWHGVDGSGQRVPPGLYIYQVEIEADGGTARQFGTVRVVY